VLQACDHFQLTAETLLRGRELSVSLQSGDPIFPRATLSRRYDSKLEERFSLEFRKVAPAFDIIREPEPLRAGNHLIFPDFAIFHRRDPTRRVLVEIVGFWTPGYLKNKIQRLRDARATDMLLCIDDSLNCTDDALTDVRNIIRYKRRIDAEAVLEMVEAMMASEPRSG